MEPFYKLIYSVLELIFSCQMLEKLMPSLMKSGQLRLKAARLKVYPWMHSVWSMSKRDACDIARNPNQIALKDILASTLIHEDPRMMALAISRDESDSLIRSSLLRLRRWP